MKTSELRRRLQATVEELISEQVNQGNATKDDTIKDVVQELESLTETLLVLVEKEANSTEDFSRQLAYSAGLQGRLEEIMLNIDRCCSRWNHILSTVVSKKQKGE